MLRFVAQKPFSGDAECFNAEKRSCLGHVVAMTGPSSADRLALTRFRSGEKRRVQRRGCCVAAGAAQREPDVKKDCADGLLA